MRDTPFGAVIGSLIGNGFGTGASSALRRIAALALLLPALLSGLTLAPREANAHEMSMVEMALREVAPGEFVWQWTAVSDRTGVNGLTAIWPDSCSADANMLHCGEAGLNGRIAFEGVGKRYSAVLLKVYWRDGQSRVYTLTDSQPSVQLFGSADDRRGWSEIASAYTVLGIEHILGGYDHIAFVLGLLFLVGFQRKLLWTLTAFTVAHSLTLASSALGWMTLRPPPVEAVIALSIMLVASEALHDRQTLSRRLPSMVAFLFGLVHGLGFARALQDIGLPEHHLPVALLTFNVGVEVGQLLCVGVAWVVYRQVRRVPALLAPARTATLYTIGALASFWTLGRVVAILG